LKERVEPTTSAKHTVYAAGRAMPESGRGRSGMARPCRNASGQLGPLGDRPDLGSGIGRLNPGPLGDDLRRARSMASSRPAKDARDREAARAPHPGRRLFALATRAHIPLEADARRRGS